MLLLLVLAGAVAAAVIGLSSGSSVGPSAPAARGFVQSWMQDDQYVLDQPLDAAGNRVVAATLDTFKSLGVDVVRVQVLWAAVAPDALSKTRPRGFAATNPAAYPAAGWAKYDRLVVFARARHLQVNFDLTAPGPLWAMRMPSIDPTVTDHYAPSVSEFRQFVTATGRRYSGHFKLPGTKIALPRVNDWSIWNEPNQPGWLAPQYRTLNGTKVLDSPRLYREYADAAFGALTRTGHGPSTDTILFGELAPEGCEKRGPGCSYPSYDEPVTAMAFLRALYCVDERFRPLTGLLAAALHCPASRSAFVAHNRVLFDATGFAHHPYYFSQPPDRPATDPNFVPLSELGRLEGALDRIFETYGVHRRLPIYLTEYGYETNPPDQFRGVSPAIQSRYLNQAQYLAMRDRRVRSMAQFLLYDSAPQTQYPVGSPQYWQSFQTGLRYADGKPKPSFNSYRLPIYLPQTTFHRGTPVLVWGMLRPAPNDTREHALIQWRPLHGAYRTVTSVATNDPSGELTARVTLPGTGAVRILWSSPSHERRRGQELVRSRAVGVVSR